MESFKDVVPYFCLRSSAIKVDAAIVGAWSMPVGVREVAAENLILEAVLNVRNVAIGIIGLNAGNPAIRRLSHADDFAVPGIVRYELDVLDPGIDRRSRPRKRLRVCCGACSLTLPCA